MEYKDIEWRDDCVHFSINVTMPTRMEPGEECIYCDISGGKMEMDEDYHCTEYCVGYEFDHIVAERLKAETDYENKVVSDFD